MSMQRSLLRNIWMCSFCLLGIMGVALAMGVTPWSHAAEEAKPVEAKSADTEKAKGATESIDMDSVAQLEGFGNWTTSVVFTPDGKTLLVGTHNAVHVFDVASRKQTATWATASGYVRSLALLPGGMKVVVGAYQSATIWDIAGGKKERDLPKHRGFVTSIAVSPDGKLLATGCDDEVARLIRIEDGSLVKTLEHSREPVLSVVFSPDGKLLATAAGEETRVTRPGTARLWNVETGEIVRAMDGIPRAATTVAFVASGKQLIVGSVDEKAYLFDVESGNPVSAFAGHGRPINAIAISADGQTAFTGSGGRNKGKNELMIWRVEDGKILGKSDEHEAKIAALALSLDGKTVATAGYDQFVRIWDVSFLSSSEPSKTTVVAAAEKKNTSSADVTTNVATEKNAAAAEPKMLKAGIIGLDTSHAIAFTKTLNAEKQKPEVIGWKMVAAYPKGSPDIKSSTERVPGYTEEMKKMGVEIVDSIEELTKRVDVVFLETNDGRPHFEQLIPVLKAGKPCFIDKPIAGSLVDAIAIFEAAKKFKVPVFSSSSLRFGKNSLAARSGAFGKITRAETSSPASLEPTHPDLFWYGIHGVESLFTVMGTGCVSVKRGQTAEGKIEVIGQWTDGRVGTYREGKGYEGKVIGDKGEGPVGSYDGYDPLLLEVLKFARSGQPPVSEQETLEIYAFMEAADESKRQNGASVTLESVMAKARVEAAKKVSELK